MIVGQVVGEIGIAAREREGEGGIVFLLHVVDLRLFVSRVGRGQKLQDFRIVIAPVVLRIGEGGDVAGFDMVDDRHVVVGLGEDHVEPAGRKLKYVDIRGDAHLAELGLDHLRGVHRVRKVRDPKL